MYNKNCDCLSVLFRSESEKRLAVESLKRTLLDDFHRRNIEPELANKILESRMEPVSYTHLRAHET